MSTATLDLARTVLRTEAAAILGLVDRLDDDFERAVDTPVRVPRPRRSSPAWASRASSAARSRRRSRAPARRRSSCTRPKRSTATSARCATTTSCSPLSHSGETEEVIRLLESIRRIGARLIAITGDPRSTLARAADVTLNCGIAEEACPLNLAPTASTTAALALGDALAMTLLGAQGLPRGGFRVAPSRRAARPAPDAGRAGDARRRRRADRRDVRRACPTSFTRCRASASA